MSVSPRWIVPDVGRNAPAMMLKSVVLPAPFGPMRPTISSWATARSTSCTARSPPKRLETPSTFRRIGGCWLPAIPRLGREERIGCLILRPYQDLLATLPLVGDRQDLARSVGIELDRPNDRLFKVGCANGVAQAVVVGPGRASKSVDDHLDHRVRRTGGRLGRLVVLGLVTLLQLFDPWKFQRR